MFCYGSLSRLTWAWRKPAWNIPVALHPPPWLGNCPGWLWPGTVLLYSRWFFFFFNKKLLTSEISLLVECYSCPYCLLFNFNFQTYNSCVGFTGKLQDNRLNFRGTVNNVLIMFQMLHGTCLYFLKFFIWNSDLSRCLILCETGQS